VSNYSLTAESALAEFSHGFDGVKLREITERSVVSMAIPKESEQALRAQIKASLGVLIPEIGQFSVSEIESTQLLRLQDDMCFVLFDYSGDRAVPEFEQKVSDAYLSDQSDSWVMLRLSGEKAREALARICSIDLHPAVFKPGSVTRTSMEHMGVIIVCEAENQYTLMALRSYADSFLHAIRVSIENVV
jgi:heterotetrameric sarcosine oxidase gamma subunit